MMTLTDALAVLSGEQQQQISLLRSFIASECPKTMKALKLIDVEYTTLKRPKGYNLVKRDSKKYGFLYYVRYWHEGRILSSKWCTHTNIHQKACEFAEQNRENLITRYLQKNDNGIVRFFKNFYQKDSKVYQCECKRNGELSEGRQKRYQSVMVHKFIPFLTKRHITLFEQITVPLLDDFQDTLLAEIKAQSVNGDMMAISKAFKYLMRKGIIQENPCLNLAPVPVRSEDKKTHGCYEIKILNGVFNKRWKDKTAYLLNMLIYTTDMRNIEIRHFSKSDILTIGGCHFIDVKKSKTENGVRLVPLHDTVYKKVMAYAAGKDDETPIFGDLSTHRFSKAYKELGRILGVSNEFLKEQNITYYSGRHFWKTLMNAGGLGDDIEEIFMGHKVSGNVAKLYNHRDMQGKKLLVQKAREVFRILDTRLFSRGRQ